MRSGKSSSRTKVPSISRLSSDINRFIKENAVIMNALRATRNALIEKLDALVQDLFPGGYLRLYGSSATHLDLPWSDVDLLVSNVYTPTTQDLVLSLTTLAEKLQVQEWAESVTVHEMAVVPVIKLKAKLEDQQSVEIDLTFDDSNLLEHANFGMATTMASIKFLKTFPILRVLVPVLKQLLKAKGFNSSYKGQR